MKHQILQGDCIEVMRTLPDASVDSIVTDPPYELGFMGKKWDSTGIANSVPMWTEAMRVLKPGGHLLAFSAARTYHRMVCAIEDAGLEVRDQIMWVYGSGFPKSHNLDGDHKGWGTALKPAHEPICVARKPFIGTVAENVLRHGTGAMNIDACRVETADNLNGGAYSSGRKASESGWHHNGSTIHCSTGEEFVQPAGRWPANLIHDGSDEVIAAFPQAPGQRRLDVGSAARFFYCAKTSTKERNAGMPDGMKNTHPTVKPLALCAYLQRLVTPVGGTTLDIFMGSGSFGVAAKAEGFGYIGIDNDESSIAIATHRMAA